MSAPCGTAPITIPLVIDIALEDSADRVRRRVLAIDTGRTSYAGVLSMPPRQVSASDLAAARAFTYGTLKYGRAFLEAGPSEAQRLGDIVHRELERALRGIK